jgi:hypothetical protein
LDQIDGGRELELARLPANFDAFHLGHFPIDEADHGHGGTLQHVVGIDSVFGLDHLVALRRQEAPQELAIDIKVVGDEYEHKNKSGSKVSAY